MCHQLQLAGSIKGGGVRLPNLRLPEKLKPLLIAIGALLPVAPSPSLLPASSELGTGSALMPSGRRLLSAVTWSVLKSADATRTRRSSSPISCSSKERPDRP